MKNEQNAQKQEEKESNAVVLVRASVRRDTVKCGLSLSSIKRESSSSRLHALTS